MGEERILTYAQAINEGTRDLMREDESVLVMGLGVPTPTGVFGTTTGLLEEFGSRRVLDTPAAENGMTGIAVGMAISGLRPILVHHRVDFAVLSMEPIVNQAAKWHFMYGGNSSAPLTIRMIIGRGWGQGPQHSQSLQAWFAHIPGLQVFMPATAADAYETLRHSVTGNVPSVILEHRWLYDLKGEIPSSSGSGFNPTPIVARGNDVTVVATSITVVEALKAQEMLLDEGISLEIINMRMIAPFSNECILDSVRKTKRLLVLDTSHRSFGVGAEVIAQTAEHLGSSTAIKMLRLASYDTPTPTSAILTRDYYPTSLKIAEKAFELATGSTWKTQNRERHLMDASHDTPGQRFQGPY